MEHKPEAVDFSMYPSLLPDFFNGLRPDPKISIAEHAAAHFKLPEGSPFPGNFDVRKTPYLAKIMACLEFDSPYEEVVFAKGCQLGGTSVSLCFLLWVANCGISAPALIVFPTEKNSQRFVKKKFRPAIQDCEALTAKLSERTLERESLELFNFPGGTFSFGHSRAPNTLRMDSCRAVIFDEVSDYPPETGQGDPVEIGRGRTNAFEGRRKIYLVSTPANEATCRITKALKKTDKQRYFVPCPACNEFQTVDWKRIKWTMGPHGNPVNVHMECVACASKIHEHHKTAMLAKGQWRATDPEKASDKTIGFHLSALYSPPGMLSWQSIVEQFLASKNDPTQLKVWTNNILGEPWKEGVGVSTAQLKKRIVEYRADPLPEGVGLITAGVDINASFASIEIVGWGIGRTSWGLAYHRINREPTDPMLWVELDRYLSQTFTHGKGHKLRIAATCVDTGYATDLSYEFIKRHMASGRNIIGVKGIEGSGKPLISTKPSYTNKGNIPLFSVSSHTSNDLLYAWMNASNGSAGYCSFPSFYSETSFFDEIAAMKKVNEIKRGKAISRWIQDEAMRAEANDCRRYAMAALFHLGILGIELDDLVRKINSLEATR